MHKAPVMLAICSSDNNSGGRGTSSRVPTGRQLATAPVEERLTPLLPKPTGLALATLTPFVIDKPPGKCISHLRTLSVKTGLSFYLRQFSGHLTLTVICSDDMVVGLIYYRAGAMSQSLFKDMPTQAGQGHGRTSEGLRGQRRINGDKDAGEEDVTRDAAAIGGLKKCW